MPYARYTFNTARLGPEDCEYFCQALHSKTSLPLPGRSDSWNGRLTTLAERAAYLDAWEKQVENPVCAGRECSVELEFLRSSKSNERGREFELFAEEWAEVGVEVAVVG